MQQADIKNSIEFGKRVKKLRQKVSESMNAFVMNKGGITTATWSRIENGLNDFKLSTIIKTAAILELTVSELMDSIDFDYTIDEEDN